MILPVARPPAIVTPSWMLPEMTLRAAGLVPPIVLPGELKMLTPLKVFARGWVPATLVPM